MPGDHRLENRYRISASRRLTGHSSSTVTHTHTPPPSGEGSYSCQEAITSPYPTPGSGAWVGQETDAKQSGSPPFPPIRDLAPLSFRKNGARERRRQRRRASASREELYPAIHESGLRNLPSSLAFPSRLHRSKFAASFLPRYCCRHVCVRLSVGRRSRLQVFLLRLDAPSFALEELCCPPSSEFDFHRLSSRDRWEWSSSAGFVLIIIRSPRTG